MMICHVAPGLRHHCIKRRRQFISDIKTPRRQPRTKEAAAAAQSSPPKEIYFQHFSAQPQAIDIAIRAAI